MTMPLLGISREVYWGLLGGNGENLSSSESVRYFLPVPQNAHARTHEGEPGDALGILFDRLCSLYDRFVDYQALRASHNKHYVQSVSEKGWGGRGGRSFCFLRPFHPQEIFFTTGTLHLNETPHLEPNLRLSHQEKGGKTHGHRNIDLPTDIGHDIGLEVI